MNTEAFSWIVVLSIVAGCAAQGSLPVLDSCIVCDSGRNITCATDPDSNHRTACEGVPVLSGCYTRIAAGGFTLRGCTSGLDADVLAACQNNSDLCSICVGESNVATHGCNNIIFPAHRHQCHQCTGALNGTCDGIPLGLPTVCEMYDPNDRCYIIRTTTSITRGCMSNPTRGTDCDNPDHCLICDIRGCNNDIGESVPTAPGSAVANTVSLATLSAALIFALTKSF